MAEPHTQSTGTGKAAPVRRASFVGFLFSLIFLTVAAIGFVGDPWWLLNPNTKWIAAGVIALTGLGMLVSALPRRSRRG